MKTVAMLVILPAALIALQGCVCYDPCDPPPAVVYRQAHVHGDGCGHHFYHNTWYAHPHRHDCGTCNVQVHVHGDGCGHHFYHNSWYAQPHAHNCGSCAPKVHVHVHGSGCGHHFWHGVWSVSVHPRHCRCSGH